MCELSSCNPASAITYLDENSAYPNLHTAVGVSFRCLVPRVNVWLWNGVEQSFQGTLRLGQEVSLNANVGDEFTFTTMIQGSDGQPRDEEFDFYIVSKEKVGILLRHLECICVACSMVIADCYAVFI